MSKLKPPIGLWEPFNNSSNHVLLLYLKPHSNQFINSVCSVWNSAFFYKCLPSYSTKSLDMGLKQSPICSFHALLTPITPNLYHLLLSTSGSDELYLRICLKRNEDGGFGWLMVQGVQPNIFIYWCEYGWKLNLLTLGFNLAFQFL